MADAVRPRDESKGSSSGSGRRIMATMLAHSAKLNRRISRQPDSETKLEKAIMPSAQLNFRQESTKYESVFPRVPGAEVTGTAMETTIAPSVAPAAAATSAQIQRKTKGKRCGQYE